MCVSKIISCKAIEVLDSRGNPTINVDITTELGIFSSMVPSGASTGSFEAVELRDGGKRYGGKGVLKAVENVNSVISPKITGLNPSNQEEIDSLLIELDGTENKSKLGANAILGVSMSICKAGAAEKKLSLYQYISKLSRRTGVILPIPQLNIINGGKHAGIENDVQEHMIMPIGAKSFKEALQMSVEVYHTLLKNLKKKFGASATHLGDEGGFAPSEVKKVSDRLDLILNAIDECGYSGKIKLALDPAASEFYKEGTYTISEKKYSPTELIDFYKELSSTYPIVSIEDGFSEEDWEGWIAFTKEMSKKIQIVGDDVLVTNPKRIIKAINLKACNALLLKLNQIGTVTESIKAANEAFKSNWSVVVSHRSGETEDSFIADVVVGIDAGQSKFGAPARSERTAKYNRLLKIEEELGSKAKYGNKVFH